MQVREALIKVRDMLRSGEIPHAQDPRKEPGFNMSVEFHQHKCGTAACIGGWMGHFIDPENPQREMYKAVDNDRKLNGLFYPSHGINWDEITPRQAADAIDLYLTKGEVDWYEVL